MTNKTRMTVHNVLPVFELSGEWWGLNPQLFFQPPAHVCAKGLEGSAVTPPPSCSQHPQYFHNGHAPAIRPDMDVYEEHLC